VNTVSDVWVLQNAGKLLPEGFSGSTLFLGGNYWFFLTTLLVAQGISIEWRDKVALDWNECRRKRSWLNLRHCPGV